jgi:NADPH:quinone reductase-like Zn-dependent oxidoreductase
VDAITHNYRFLEETSRRLDRQLCTNVTLLTITCVFNSHQGREMRAIELQHFNAGGLRMVEREPLRPGPGELLVRVRAASLNYRDLEIAQGRYAMPVQIPIVPLSDAVAEVVEHGEGESRFRPGDRVCAAFFANWIEGRFDARHFARQWGCNVDGMLQEWALWPESAAVHAPRHLDHEAASLPVAALTSWCALIEAGVLPGHTVLIIGTGGVSLFALQFARLFGAEPIVVVGREEVTDQVRSLGAAHVINRQEYPDWSEQVLACSGGQGVDLVVEVSGAQTWAQSVSALRVGGTIAVVGYASGAQVEFDLRQPFIAKRARLQGHTVGSRSQFEAMIRAMEINQLKPVIDSSFQLEEFSAAYRRMGSGQAFGKVLIRL